MAEWGVQSPTDHRYTAATNVRSSATTTYKPLADGTAGSLQTLGAMRDAVKIGLAPEYVSYRDGAIVQAAYAIAADAPSDDEMAVITAVYRFCRDQISYIDHPWNMQVVQDAKRTIQLRTGDCVSKSVCLSTLLASLGIKSRFVAQATTPEGFDHVYVEAQTGGSWVALDPTADGQDGRPRGDVGWSQRTGDGGFEMAYSIF